MKPKVEGLSNFTVRSCSGTFIVVRLSQPNILKANTHILSSIQGHSKTTEITFRANLSRPITSYCRESILYTYACVYLRPSLVFSELYLGLLFFHLSHVKYLTLFQANNLFCMHTKRNLCKPILQSNSLSFQTRRIHPDISMHLNNWTIEQVSTSLVSWNLQIDLICNKSLRTTGYFLTPLFTFFTRL